MAPTTTQPPQTSTSATVEHVTTGPPSPPDGSDTEAVAPSCGALNCMVFDSPRDAFAHVIRNRPLVVAVGEAHAQKGTEHIPTATKRFTDDLLPMLKDQASDLVVELWVPDPKCPKKKVAKVQKAQKEVTEKQAGTNQNEFLTLGNKSKELGIRPHALQPSCAEYDKILEAGGQDISQMLTMIAGFTENFVKRILKRNQSQTNDKAVIAYGGALHNDLKPREGREGWSFGPALASHTSGRYVEIDLIVPEYIKDTESWRAFPWYGHFDKSRHPTKTILFNPSPASYVLIFPRTTP